MPVAARLFTTPPTVGHPPSIQPATKAPSSSTPAPRFKPLPLHLTPYEAGWPPPNTQSNLRTRHRPQHPRHQFFLSYPSLTGYLLTADPCSLRALQCDLSLPRR